MNQLNLNELPGTVRIGWGTVPAQVADLSARIAVHSEGTAGRCSQIAGRFERLGCSLGMMYHHFRENGEYKNLSGIDINKTYLPEMSFLADSKLD